MPAKLVTLSRSLIEIQGADAARVLHNLCTADIQSLRSGKGTEAFFTNVQGKTIGHGFVFRHDDKFVIDTVADQAKFLMAHADRYIIREDAQLNDLTEQFGHLVVYDDLPDCMSAHLQKLPQPLDFCIAPPWGAIVRTPFVSSENVMICCESQDCEAHISALQEAGCELVEGDEFESRRILHGFPLFAADLDDRNLPQELGRDDRAISFTKGCYLGQETVARLDALGHVNWILRAVRASESGTLQHGLELSVGDKLWAKVRSTTANGELALAYVRAESADDEKTQQTNQGPVQVIGFQV